MKPTVISTASHDTHTIGTTQRYSMSRWIRWRTDLRTSTPVVQNLKPPLLVKLFIWTHIRLQDTQQLSNKFGN